MTNKSTADELRFESINEQLNKIASALVRGFNRIDISLAEKADKADMDRVLGLLGEMAKRQEVSDHERLVMIHQMDRSDRWTHELAQKIGHKLST